jgi:LuxR family transcriptional regulator, maltose regulon positive regulatory protein
VPEAVIETKLLLPRLRQRTVPRSRLEDLLRRGAERTLTLLSAPAGFGKTTLLGGWLAHRGGFPIAWVSLDERDTDPSVFWTHLLHAVDRVVPGSATSALAQLGSNEPHIDEILSLLVNEPSVTATDLSVVLDDYHLAESPSIQPGMLFLLEHLPPQVHLVISTRGDPALPLARLSCTMPSSRWLTRPTTTISPSPPPRRSSVWRPGPPAISMQRTRPIGPRPSTSSGRDTSRTF